MPCIRVEVRKAGSFLQLFGHTNRQEAATPHWCDPALENRKRPPHLVRVRARVRVRVRVDCRVGLEWTVADAPATQVTLDPVNQARALL